MSQAAEIQDRPVTADELFEMPDDGLRRELIRGEIRTRTPPGYVHGRIGANVTSSLAQHVRQNRLGSVYAAETGFVLQTRPDTVRAPEGAFIRQERVQEVGDAPGYWPGAPDLAAEVVSPSDAFVEVEGKVFEWLDAGTQMVVVVNPKKRSIIVCRSRTEITDLTEEDVLDGGDVVPGWTLPVREIFE